MDALQQHLVVLVERLQNHFSCTTGFRSSPSPSISTSTTSPSFIYTGGLRATPTPGGVPVKITSPGSSVKTCDKYVSNSATLKIIWFVLLFCITSPLSRKRIGKFCGSLTSSFVTSTGPVGAKVSNVLPT